MRTTKIDYRAWRIFLKLIYQDNIRVLLIPLGQWIKQNFLWITECYWFLDTDTHNLLYRDTPKTWRVYPGRMHSHYTYDFTSLEVYMPLEINILRDSVDKCKFFLTLHNTAMEDSLEDTTQSTSIGNIYLRIPEVDWFKQKNQFLDRHLLCIRVFKRIPYLLSVMDLTSL